MGWRPRAGLVTHRNRVSLGGSEALTKCSKLRWSCRRDRLAGGCLVSPQRQPSLLQILAPDMALL